MKCPDTDSLLTIGTAIDWQVEEFLDHLRDCSECRESLLGLAVVHRALNEVSEPHPATLSRAMAEVTAVDAGRERLWQAVSLSLTPLFAGLTAFFVVASGDASLSASAVAGTLAAFTTLGRAMAPAGKAWVSGEVRRSGSVGN